MKKLLTIPGGPPPFEVFVHDRGTYLSWVNCYDDVRHDVMHVPNSWLDDIPKKKVRYFKPLKELLLALYEYHKGNLSRDYIEWAFDHAETRVGAARYMPDSYIEEREE